MVSGTVAHIVAIGMSNTDLVCSTPKLPRAGETVAGTSFDTYAGGKGANQAVAAARSGAAVAFIGAVGDDAYGTDRLVDLQREGIDTNGVQQLAGVNSGIALIVVSDAGENQIVTVAGANAKVDPASATSALGSKAFDLVMLTWELEPSTSMSLLGSISDEIPIVLNTAPFHDSVRDVFPDDRVILIANEVEAGQLLGRDVDGDSALDAAQEILELGCRAVVITLGAAGAVGVDNQGPVTVRPPEVTVVDTTGAGDTFCGVFATLFAEGASFEDAITAGVHAGSLATTQRGAQPSIPSREAIERSLSAG